MTLELVSPADPVALDASRVLGGFDIGILSRTHALPWPVQPVLTPLLDGGDALMHEAWLADAVVDQGEEAGLAWRRSGEMLFGVVTLLEADAPATDGASALCLLGEQAYTRIFRLLDALGVPHLWRVWNYIPDIHGAQAGLERYRQFNRGRGDAFERCARSVTEQVPAACALGVPGGPLTIAFLAGRTPLFPIENPRQVSAYLYPLPMARAAPLFHAQHWRTQAVRSGCLSPVRPASWDMKACIRAMWSRKRRNRWTTWRPCWLKRHASDVAAVLRGTRCSTAFTCGTRMMLRRWLPQWLRGWDGQRCLACKPIYAGANCWSKSKRWV